MLLFTCMSHSRRILATRAPILALRNHAVSSTLPLSKSTTTVEQHKPSSVFGWLESNEGENFIYARSTAKKPTLSKPVARSRPVPPPLKDKPDLSLSPKDRLDASPATTKTVNDPKSGELSAFLDKSSPYYWRKRQDLPDWRRHTLAIKEKYGKWNPIKKASREDMDKMRLLFQMSPEENSVPRLAEKFRISPEAVRRILRSKFVPSPERMQKQKEAREASMKRTKEWKLSRLQEEEGVDRQEGSGKSRRSIWRTVEEEREEAESRMMNRRTEGRKEKHEGWEGNRGGWREKQERGMEKQEGWGRKLGGQEESREGQRENQEGERMETLEKWEKWMENQRMENQRIEYQKRRMEKSEGQKEEQQEKQMKKQEGRKEEQQERQIEKHEGRKEQKRRSMRISTPSLLGY